MGASLPKPRRIRSKAYLAYIRRQPCIIDICTAASQAAHIGKHGMGTKVSDFCCLPICGGHHLTDRLAIHKIGEAQFQETFGIDLKQLQIEFLIRYLADELHQEDQ